MRSLRGGLAAVHLSPYAEVMSLNVGLDTQRAVEVEAGRVGLSVDAYLQRVMLEASVRRHAL